MEQQATPHQLLGTTAHWTAAVRARESARANRLFNDPWASALAGAEGAAWLEQRPEDSTLPIVLRTRYFDDFLLRIASQDGIRQIVLLAAGLDTRAFRLGWPNNSLFFELDQSEVLRHKERILRTAGVVAKCERCVMEADLSADLEGLLIKAGFEPHRPSAWLLEGFLFYLPNETTIQLFDKINSLTAKGSRLGFDLINSSVLTSPYTKPWIEMQAKSGALWIGTMDDPEKVLSRLGWSASLTQAGAADANHGRWKLPVIPTKMPDMPHNWYVMAEK